MKTSERLAFELRAVASKASADHAAKYEALAIRASTGEFDDYGTAHVCGPTALHGELVALGFTKFSARVANGEFDATKEESDEWARSPDGQNTAKMIPSEMRDFLEMKLNS